MRFESITLKNYRQFRDAELVFGEPRGYDIHLVIGKNGTGKTNLLNAINWCLYGDEPHLHLNSQKLPLHNTKAEGSRPEVAVEIWSSREDGKKLGFIREKRGGPEEVRFLVESSGGYETYPRDAFERHISRLIPQEIRSFFFFDGELLDNYFRNFPKIRGEINRFARIDVLDRIKDNLDKLAGEFAKGVRDVGKELETLSSEIEKLRGQLSKYKEQIEQLEKAKQELEENIAELEKELKDQPDVRNLVVRCKSLEIEEKRTEEELEKKRDGKRQVMARLAKVVFLGEAVKKVLQLAQEKRKKGELPPPVNITLLDSALRDGTCPVCRRPLDPKSRKSIEGVLQEVQNSSLVGNRLLELERVLTGLKTRAESDARELQRLEEDITKLEKNLKRQKEDIESIKSRLNSCNVREVERKSKKLEETKQMRDHVLQKIGECKVFKDTCEKKLEQKEREYKDLLEKHAKSEENARISETCHKASKALERAKGRILGEIRKEIELATQETFFRLLWKKESFKNVQIREDYTIEVFDREGRNCLGSLSAAERELLALSFILALHSLSGFQAPLVIDTPLARVSDEHRENFAEALLAVSKGKQIILLLTPAEFSEEVEDVLKPHAATIRWLRMSPDERETSFAEEP
uniref:YhaN AAA domain-containing protein n=1 Tax=Candidatus Caldatribacterium saccharofermentans TaxID=1454753 RepID=A0A7V4TGB5_9BACT